MLRDGDLVKKVGRTKFLQLAGKWSAQEVEEQVKKEEEEKKTKSVEKNRYTDEAMVKESDKENICTVNKPVLEPKLEKKLTVSGGKLMILDKEVTCKAAAKDKDTSMQDQPEVKPGKEDALQAVASSANGDMHEKVDVDGSSADFVRFARAKWLSLLLTWLGEEKCMWY